MVETYSIVPEEYKEKDPRALLFHFPSMPKVVYAKKMQQFCFWYALEAAETVAHKQGYVLLPYECMHWQRRKNFAAEGRKIKIGRRSFFLVRPYEMTDIEREKLTRYLDELRDAG